MGFGSLPEFPEWFKALARWYNRRVEPMSDLHPADTATDEFLRTWNTRAHLAYAIYGDSVGWKNFAGNAMPTWDDLPRRIRASWCLTVQAVHDTVKENCRNAAKEMMTHTVGWADSDVLDAIQNVE